jgi:hypothetical protein
MFGPRQRTLPIFRSTPEYLGNLLYRSVPVHYVDPPIVVDSAQRVALIAERRRREATINAHYRTIASRSYDRPLWVVVGDSVELGIQDGRCRSDLCGNYDYLDNEPRTWGRWSLSDSSVATLHSSTLSDAYTQFPYDPGRAMMLMAVRPGRVKVRATGVHTPADTMPSLTPLDSIVEREVLITRPLATFTISPRPTSMVAGSPMTFTVRAVDRTGGTIEGLPVTLKWDTNGASVPAAVTFVQPGRHWVAASLGAYTDSLAIDVRPASSGP